VVGGFLFRQITTGFSHSCGITSAGKAYCWGENASGQLGTANFLSSSTPMPVSGGRVFVQIAAGDYMTCGITTTQAAYCWGGGWLGDGALSNKNVPTAVLGSLAFRAITINGLHTCGLTVSDSAFCWGLNRDGELGTTTGSICPEFFNYSCSTTPTPVAGGLQFSTISAGKGHTAAIAASGEAWAWGNNSWGQLGNNSFSSSFVPVRVSQPR
jgi:alpha-tubulin suppressor-like RCC1 family protein